MMSQQDSSFPRKFPLPDGRGLNSVRHKLWLLTKGPSSFPLPRWERARVRVKQLRIDDWGFGIGKPFSFYNPQSAISNRRPPHPDLLPQGEKETKVESAQQVPNSIGRGRG
jgi:hypothetical protein